MTALPNPFLSAASLQPETSSPLSSLSEAAVTNSISDGVACCSVPSGQSDPSVRLDFAPSGTEAAVSHRTAAASATLSNRPPDVPPGPKLPADATMSAGLSNIQSSCGGDVRVGANGANSLHHPEASGVTPGPQDSISDIPEIFRVANSAAPSGFAMRSYLCRHPPSLRYGATSDSRFVPDRAAIWDAMFDETAPRATLDPIWGNDAPLFLKRRA